MRLSCFHDDIGDEEAARDAKEERWLGDQDRMDDLYFEAVRRLPVDATPELVE